MDIPRDYYITVIWEKKQQKWIVNVFPPIEVGASCFNENSTTDSKELRRLTHSPQA